MLPTVSDKFSAQDLTETWPQTIKRQDRCNGVWTLSVNHYK